MSGVRAVAAIDPEGRKSPAGMTPWYELTE
jgi:hypothetical protein